MLASFRSRRELLHHKTLRVVEAYEDAVTGCHLLQIHELDPLYKIDRIVYRERSREGWFKEISPQDYFRKVTKLREGSSPSPGRGETGHSQPEERPHEDRQSNEES